MATNLILRAQAYAIQAHAEANHLYDGHPYSYHLAMVADWAEHFGYLLADSNERVIATAAAFCHDLIEDARQTFNDVKGATSEEVAEIAFALTNDKGRTRAERAGENYYRGIREAGLVAIFVKICDRLGNAKHSASTGSRMLGLYRKEHAHFKASLGGEHFPEMWRELENILGLKD